MSNRSYPHVEGVRHRLLNIGGVTLHVAEAGAPDGEPVVLLHGFPQHWYAWRRVIAHLPDQYRLICLDQRGFGWSDAPKNGYDTETGVDDLIGVLDVLDLAAVHLIGHQWGAGIGFAACLRDRTRFDSFLALNMVHPWTDRRVLRKNAWRFWYTAFWEYPYIGRRVLRHWPGFTRFHIRRSTYDPTSWEPGDVEEFVESTREPARARAGESLHWQYVMREIVFTAARKQRLAKQLEVPTLVLTGDQDPTVPSTLLRSADGHADDLRTQAVSHCGGYLPTEHPDLVAEAFNTLVAMQGRGIAP